MRWAVVVLVACGSKPAPVASPPSPPASHPAFCASDPSLYANGDVAVVCEHTTCVGYREGVTGTVAGEAREDITWPALINHDAIDACAVDEPNRCRMVGPNARDAIHETMGDFENPVEPVTKDLTAAAINGLIWDLVHDRSYRYALAKVSSFDSVGNAFVAVLGPEDCSKATIVSEGASIRGTPFVIGHHITLDDTRLVTAPCGSHTLSVIDVTRGEVATTLELPPEADGASIVRIDAHTAALLWPQHLAWVHLPDGQPATLGTTITIPRCPGP